MFGIVKPCRHQLPPSLHREWMGHLCGLCLTLRDHHGQSSRVVTNTDAVVLSILVAAQRRDGVATTTAAPCVLRGMRRQHVVSAGDPAAVHAAAVSLAMAATKVEDHALDHDGAVGRLPETSRRVGRRWSEQGDDLADLVGFEIDCVREAVTRSNELEAEHLRTGRLRPFVDYAAPTEAAAAAVFRHTAILADRPENAEPLERIGRAFGRIVYLLDAAEDAEDDLAKGRFNALAAHHRDAEVRRAAANDLFREAHASMGAAFGELHLTRPELARAVLIGEVHRAGHRVLHVDHGASCEARAHSPAGRVAQQVTIVPKHLARSATASVRSSATAAKHALEATAADARSSTRASARAVASVGLATIAVAGAGLAVFRPENPDDVPFDPSQAQPFPGQQPYPQQPYPQQPGYGDMGMDPNVNDPNNQNRAADLASDASDCFCDGCACCCCDSCDCCDCCDC